MSAERLGTGPRWYHDASENHSINIVILAAAPRADNVSFDGGTGARGLTHRGYQAKRWPVRRGRYAT